MKKKILIKTEINRTIKQEQNILKKDNSFFLEQQTKNFVNNINNKIPFNAKEKFMNAFSKGFIYVFEKGEKYIEKTYDKEKMLDEYTKDIARFNIDNKKRYLRTTERKAKMKTFLNTGISTIEGTAVGFMGLATALADVPVFISVLIKQLNEIALHYGFDYQREEEKIFMLNIIETSVLQEERKLMASKLVDQIGYSIDIDHSINQTLKETVENTSKAMADFITASKLMQSIPVAGSILGGINNYKFMSYIGDLANIKYKKRYLYKMMIASK